jgi:hypothetical protein
MARILVGLETNKGLVEELVIKKGEDCFQPILNYEGIPFKCGQCHSYGHITTNYIYPNQSKVWDQ